MSEGSNFLAGGLPSLTQWPASGPKKLTCFAKTRLTRGYLRPKMQFPPSFRLFLLLSFPLPPLSFGDPTVLCHMLPLFSQRRPVLPFLLEYTPFPHPISGVP